MYPRHIGISFICSVLKGRVNPKVIDAIVQGVYISLKLNRRQVPMPI